MWVWTVQQGTEERIPDNGKEDHLHMDVHLSPALVRNSQPSGWCGVHCVWLRPGVSSQDSCASVRLMKTTHQCATSRCPSLLRALPLSILLPPSFPRSYSPCPGSPLYSCRSLPLAILTHADAQPASSRKWAHGGSGGEAGGSGC